MKNIVLVGGDIRMMLLKGKLESEGYRVETLGLYDNDQADFKKADAVILPVPTTKDKETVFTPLSNRKILLKDIADALTLDQPILCCNYNFEGKNCFDYNASDSYALLNAVPTAEGAIKIAIENTDFTLWKSKVLVIGYGRVGKILADRLKKIGADVTVSARKSSDFATLDAYSIAYIKTGCLNNKPLQFDIVFNTVDFPVLYESAFKGSRCRLAIDLSSKGGFDMHVAEKNGVRAIFASGLPGKIAPATAADILFSTVINYLEN